MEGKTGSMRSVGRRKLGSMRSLDQWGGEIGSKKSMRRGSEFHEISGEGKILSHEISRKGEGALLDQ